MYAVAAGRVAWAGGIGASPIIASAARVAQELLLSEAFTDAYVYTAALAI